MMATAKTRGHNSEVRFSQPEAARRVRGDFGSLFERLHDGEDQRVDFRCLVSQIYQNPIPTNPTFYWGKDGLATKKDARATCAQNVVRASLVSVSGFCYEP